MEIQITKMELSDLQTIAPYLTTDFDDFWSLNTLEQELNYENSHYIVAKSETKFGLQILGFAGIRVTFDQADLMNIVVNKNYRNKKIGSTLLSELLNICNKLHLKNIILEVNENNKFAISMYEKNGFKKISERKNYYKNQTALIMQKSCH